MSSTEPPPFPPTLTALPVAEPVPGLHPAAAWLGAVAWALMLSLAAIVYGYAFAEWLPIETRLSIMIFAFLAWPVLLAALAISLVLPCIGLATASAARRRIGWSASIAWSVTLNGTAILTWLLPLLLVLCCRLRL